MYDVLPYALGIALSPVPIAVVLVCLTGARAVANGSLFALGWVAGVAALAGAFAALVSAGDLTDEHPAWIAVLDVILGLSFVVAAAVLLWRRRRREPRSTSVIAGVDTLTPAHTAGLGIVLSGVNPKVMALALGAAITLAGADTSAAQTTGALVLFTAIGALGVVVPLAVYAAFPSRSRTALIRARAALERHQATVLIVAGFAIGALFLVDGLRSAG